MKKINPKQWLKKSKFILIIGFIAILVSIFMIKHGVSQLTEYQFKITYVGIQEEAVESVGFAPGLFDVNLFTPYRTPGINYVNDKIAVITFLIDTDEVPSILTASQPYMIVEEDPYISFMIWNGSTVEEALLNRTSAINLLNELIDALDTNNTEGRTGIKYMLNVIYPDSDGDEIPDERDNCWYVSNPDQADSNDNCPLPPYYSDPKCGDACEVAGLTINIISPVNNTSYYKNYVPLNFTITNSTPISWIGYSLNRTANKTITGPINLTKISDKWNNITVYANDTSSNMGTSNTVYFFYCLADITGPGGVQDKKVDARDVALVSSLFGAKCGDTKYNAAADLNDDCKIDAKDVALVASLFGKKCF